MHESVSGMSQTRRLIVFGAGGHAREIAWLARECFGDKLDLAFVVDDARHITSGSSTHLLQALVVEEGDHYVAGVGDSALRHRAADCCEAMGLRAATLIHPRAEVCPSARFGDGCVVFPGVVISVDAVLGRHVHVNSGCTVSHDARLGDFCTLSPGVHLAGHVHCGAHAFFGIGASVINGSSQYPLTIGEGALVAAGACVTGPVPPNVMVAGVPAVVKRAHTRGTTS